MERPQHSDGLLTFIEGHPYFCSQERILDRSICGRTEFPENAQSLGQRVQLKTDSLSEARNSRSRVKFYHK